LRSASLSLVTIGLILAAEAIFVRLTHALQVTGLEGLPAAEASKAAAANHEYLVVMMLLGAMVGMISSFGVSDPKANDQLMTMVLLPIPMLATLTLGVALGGHRVLSLVLLPVITAGGTYLRRFGPRGLLSGILLFLGFFLGFFLHAALSLHDLGWVAAAVGVGLAVAIAVRFFLFFPNQTKALQRTQGSFVARGRKVARLALDLFDDPRHDPRTARRLEGQVRRLNEAALMIDAQLGDPAAVDDGSSRQQLHQRFFDLELALTNVARFTVALARLDLPEAARSEVRLALLDVVRRNAAGAEQHAERLDRLLEHYDGARSIDPDGIRAVLLHRFAGSIEALASAASEWLSVGTAAQRAEGFEPAVTLFGGWLPGSAGVSSMASVESGDRLGDRVRLQPWTRTAIQMGVALGMATALGDLVSPSRYYWAVIAVFITFMGANNAGEQTRKALFRVGGTVVGIGIGSLMVDAVGHHTHWAIAVILATLYIGFYLQRVNYTFMVIAITVVVSQLYQELNEFSNSLLLYRLAETALGATVAILVVTFVFPLRTRRVLRVAFRNHVRAVGRLVDHASEALMTAGPPRDQDGLSNDARAVDASYQALVATAQPLRRNLLGHVDEEMGRVIRLASASRTYSRDLVTDLASTTPFAPSLQREVILASATLHESMDTVADAMTGPSKGIYVRSSSIYDRVERSLGDAALGPDRRNPAIRDLKLIDGSMASMAEFIGLEVTDFDTSGAV
jgi:uncharacterized membrane protein YccC